MSSISIAEAKRIREEHGLTHIVIFGVSLDGQQHVTTHGKTQTNAKEAADAGNRLKSSLGWPENLCKEKPIPRVCRNCAFWKADRGYWSFNCGWSGDGTKGFCHLEPKSIPKNHDDLCRHFEPNGGQP